MTEIIKRGAAIPEGFEFQYWYGVKLIIDWYSSTPNDLNNPPWIKEEINTHKYGIFDDILLFRDSIYFFYQVKKTFSTKGGIIDEKLLLDDESELSLKKMFESYNKIKNLDPKIDFLLLVVSNKSLSGMLKEVILSSGNKFEMPFIKGTVTKAEKKTLRKSFEKKCKGGQLEDFLNRLRFVWTEHPIIEIKHQSIVPESVIQRIYHWVKKIAKKEYINSENKISYNDFQHLIKLEKTKIPLRLGFYSKSEFPRDILYDYSIDFHSMIDFELEDIDWNHFMTEIENVRKQILMESQDRLVWIEALTHLTIGFMIGFEFRSTTGFSLQFLQRYNDIEEVWEYKSKSEAYNRELEINVEGGENLSEILIVCLEFTGKPVDFYVKEYLKENKIVYKQITKIRSNPPIKSEEVSNIIKMIVESITNIAGITEIHLFSAIPLGMAILLGYNFNALPNIQLYEFNLETRKYIMSYLLKQKTGK
ncbi:MAG: SAVED domain-containing protein [Promethearchaeota archaeon]